MDVFFGAKVYGDRANLPLLALVERATRVLDVGCGRGENARVLRERFPCAVTGVTISPEEAEAAAGVFNRVVVADVESWEGQEPVELFDTILLSHVLEHLVDPWTALAGMRKLLAPGGRIYVALPNLLFLPHRLEMLFGRFRYRRYNIMDDNHLRWFDIVSCRELLERAGFRVEHFSAAGHVPLRGLRSLLPGFCRWLDRQGCRLFPGLFGWQFLLVGVAEKEPSPGGGITPCS